MLLLLRLLLLQGQRDASSRTGLLSVCIQIIEVKKKKKGEITTKTLDLPLPDLQQKFNEDRGLPCLTTSFDLKLTML